jgi:hypothetical protein
MSFPVKEEFLAQLDAALAGVGYVNRAQFIRDGVVEKLDRLGVRMAPELARPPGRIGKGDPSKHRKAVKGDPVTDSAQECQSITEDMVRETEGTVPKPEDGKQS